MVSLLAEAETVADLALVPHERSLLRNHGVVQRIDQLVGTHRSLFTNRIDVEEGQRRSRRTCLHKNRNLKGTGRSRQRRRGDRVRGFIALLRRRSRDDTVRTKMKTRRKRRRNVIVCVAIRLRTQNIDGGLHSRLKHIVAVLQRRNGRRHRLHERQEVTQ